MNFFPYSAYLIEDHTMLKRWNSKSHFQNARISTIINSQLRCKIVVKIKKDIFKPNY